MTDEERNEAVKTAYRLGGDGAALRLVVTFWRVVKCYRNPCTGPITCGMACRNGIVRPSYAKRALRYMLISLG